MAGADLVAAWEVQLPDGVHLIQAAVSTSVLQLSNQNPTRTYSESSQEPTVWILCRIKQISNKNPTEGNQNSTRIEIN
jgi:hypothetical protein